MQHDDGWRIDCTQIVFERTRPDNDNEEEEEEDDDDDDD